MARQSVSKTRATEKEKAKAISAQPSVVIAHEIVPGKFYDVDWNLMLEKDHNEEFIAELVEELMAATMGAIFKKYLERQLLPFTITRAKDAIIEIIEWQFLGRDEGEHQIRSDLGWDEDAEPHPAELDCWAQGSVPKYFVAAPPKPLEEIPELPEDEAVTEVNMPVIEEKLQEMEELPDVVSETEEVPPVNTDHLDKENESDKVADISEDIEKTASTLLGKFKSPTRKKSVKRLDDMKKHSEEIKEHADKPATNHGIPNSINKFSLGRAVTSKDAVYDEMGNMLAVLKIDPEKLPTHKVSVRFSLLEPVKDQTQSKTEKRKTQITSKAKAKTPAETFNKSTANYTKTSQQTQVNKPVITQMYSEKASVASAEDESHQRQSGLEEIELSQGVIVREGGQVKKGPGRYYRKLDILEESQKGMNPVSLKLTNPNITVADLLDRQTPILRPFGVPSPLPPIVPRSPRLSQVHYSHA